MRATAKIRTSLISQSARLGATGTRHSQLFFSSRSSQEDEAKEPTLPTVEEEEPAINKTDKQIVEEVLRGELSATALERELKDYKRAVKIRRSVIEQIEKDNDNVQASSLVHVPWKEIDYNLVHGTCCENVVGYIPIPVGIAGPVIVNDVPVAIPMATTEGCLVASTHRGIKAINEGGGANTFVTAEGMTRGPVVKMPTVGDAVKLKKWLEFQENVFQVASAFNSTSRFARLSALKVNVAGRFVYIRFKSTTGDAMGMNMISKGVEKGLAYIGEHFPQMDVLSVSGNFCTDKKATALNWIDGRGKTVVAEAVIPKKTVEKTLKTNVDALIELNLAKNLVGSAMAASVGGFNAHASNIVTAMFIATGQDPAQVIESSMCLDLFEKLPNGDLHVSVTMPAIEVGTIGGGTGLPPQSGLLQLMRVKGIAGDTELPGTNARRLAEAVATGVLAGELSLMSALAAGHLVRAHMQHNRKASPQGDDKTGVEEVLLQGSLYGSDELVKKAD